MLTAEQPDLRPSETALISMSRTYLVSSAAFVGAGALFGGGHALLWGNPLEATNDWALCLGLLASLFVHEGLHGIGFLAAGAKRSEVSFGIKWTKLMPFAHCSASLPVRGFRLAVLLPGMMLGIVPCVAGVAFNSATLTVFGILGVGMAGGDLAVVLALWGVSRDARVLDHPTEVGCYVFRDESELS